MGGPPSIGGRKNFFSEIGFGKFIITISSIILTVSQLRKAAETVEYLHSLDKPLVHGDLHPSAFVVSPDREKVILRDFGLGHALRYLIADDPARTAGTVMPWRPGYSSPQCIALLGTPNVKGDLTPSDDIFAFAGVILKVSTLKLMDLISESPDVHLKSRL